MFRLIFDEVSKLLKKPTIYILTVVLCFLIIFSFISYKPAVSTCNTLISGVDYSQESGVLYNTYYNSSDSKFSKENTNNLIKSSGSYLGVEDLINYYNNLIEKKDEFNKVSQESARTYTTNLINEIAKKYMDLYTDYSILTASAYWENNFTDFDNSVKEIYTELNNLASRIEDDTEFHSYAPTVAYLITEETKKSLTQAIKSQIKKIEDTFPFVKDESSTFKASKEIYQGFMTQISGTYFTNFSADSKELNTKSNIFNLSNIFKSTYDINMTTSDLNKIQEEYVTSALTKVEKVRNELETLYNTIKTDSVNNDNYNNKKELITLISKQYETAYNANILAKSLIVSKIQDKFNDSEFNNFIGVKEFCNDLYQDSTFNSYYFTQNYSKRIYLYTNDLAESSFNQTFSSSGTMAFQDSDIKEKDKGVSALDYSYYVLNIFSIIIVVFAIILASTSIFGEQKENTLKLLAIRPYTRNQILRAKILSILFYSFVFVILSMLITLIAGAFMYGLNVNTVLITFNSNITFAINPILLYIIYILCLFVKITFYVLLASLVAMAIKSYLWSTIINITILGIASFANGVLANIFVWKLLPFSNVDLFKYFGSGTFDSSAGLSTSFIIPNTDFFFSLIIVLIFSVIIAFITHLIFNKRDIA